MQPYTPRLYQKMALDWLRSRDKAALFLDVGLGKTSVVLRDMMEALVFGYVKRWLVVAPLRVCQTTWPSELEKWLFAQGLTVHHMYGSMNKQKRVEQSEAALGYDITLINVENLPKLIRHFGNRWPFDGVVIDESSKFKDSSTQRWRAVRTVVKHVKRLRLLTGSPCAQNLMNLWPQIYLLDQGERLTRTAQSFKMSYFRQADYMGYEWEPLPGAEERIMERIKDICLVLRPMADMPQPLFNPIEIRLDLKTLGQYRELERNCYLELEDSDEITAVSAAALTNKLSQIANGFAFHGEGEDRKVEVFHDEKIKAVEEFADETGHPFILGYHYRPDKARLAEHFGRRLEFFDASKEQLERWGKGQFQILALHPQSGGHGVDGLQHHTCTVLWYAPPWSREQFDQLNGRVTGARQVDTAFEKVQSVVNILVAKGTIDELAYDVLFARGAQQQAFLAGLRKRAAQFLR